MTSAPTAVSGVKTAKRQKLSFLGPFWPPLSPGDGRDGPAGVQNTSTQCAWVGRIHIMRLGPLTDLYGTPGAPKRARFGPKRPFWGPGGPHGAPGGQIWCQLPPIVPPGLDSWPPHTLTWYRDPSGPPGALIGPVLAQNTPFGDLGGPRRAPGDQIWSQRPPTGPPGLDSWLPYTLAWYQPSLGLPGDPKRARFGPKCP